MMSTQKLNYYASKFWQKLNATYRKQEQIEPLNCTEGLKLHLGCGDIDIRGYVNIDGRNAKHIHVVSDGFNLNEFTDCSVSEIYLCHVLEHFSFSEAKCLLKRINNKLINGGSVRLSVPDFDKLIDVYLKNDRNIVWIKHPLMGGQGYDFNFHKSLYNRESLYSLLEDCGYEAQQEWETVQDFGTDLGDWSSKKLKTPKGSWEVSLNVKAFAKK